MKPKLLLIFIAIALFASCTNSNNKPTTIARKSSPVAFRDSNFVLENKGYTPKDGFIKSDTIASEYAYMILKSIYGNDIDNQLPFDISLFQDSIWVINGTLPAELDGGTAQIVIRKNDGAILQVSHGK